jgi:putative hydrolase of the HAD superfamily
MALKALMVDVDGVIVVHPHADGWSANLEADLGLSPARLQEAFFKVHFGDIIHGRAGLHERLAPVLAEIAPHLTSQVLVDYWFANDSHLDHDLLDQLAEVRSRGLALHLATVQEHHRAAFLWNTMRLCERFDAIHYAADLGCAKPAPAFYEAIEARTGLAPDELFFIDDRADNVAGAQARGWGAALWTRRQRLAEVMAAGGASGLHRGPPLT